ncbi:MAG: hypothetical protein ACREEM_09065 [Blastocatellia bacterium]
MCLTKPLIPILLCALLCAPAMAALAQTTAFSYQGRLTDAGAPANGNYDLQFKLFDSLSGGAQQGATITRNPVAVSAGVFSVMLDFGANVFAGADRYLEIGVRPTGSGAPHTLLTPRQPITPTPYAIHTLNATQLGGVDASRYLMANANGNVGIGVTNPTSRLEIAAQDGLAITGFNPFLTFRDTGNNNRRSYIQGVNGDLVFIPQSFSPNGAAMVIKDVSGNVGIGVSNPATRLQVAGGVFAGIHATSQANAIIGISSTPSYAAIYGENNTSGSFGVYGKAGSSGTGVHGEGSPGVVGNSAAGIGVFGRNNSGNTGVFGESGSGTGVKGVGTRGVWGVASGPSYNSYAIWGEAIGGAQGSYAGYFRGQVYVDFNLDVAGNLRVLGNKNFVEPHPTDPNKMIAYVSLEGPEAGTYFRGSGRIVNGVATIQVPEDFRLVSDEKGLTVQVTPVGKPATIWLVKKSLDRIELRGSADVEFDFLVNGVRRLFKEHQPIVENTVFVPRSAEDSSFRNLKPEALRRLKDTGILNEDGSVNMETVKKLDTYKRWTQTPQKEQP